MLGSLVNSLVRGGDLLIMVGVTSVDGGSLVPPYMSPIIVIPVLWGLNSLKEVI